MTLCHILLVGRDWHDVCIYIYIYKERKQERNKENWKCWYRKKQRNDEFSEGRKERNDVTLCWWNERNDELLERRENGNDGCRDGSEERNDICGNRQKEKMMNVDETKGKKWRLFGQKERKNCKHSDRRNSNKMTKK